MISWMKYEYLFHITYKCNSLELVHFLYFVKKSIFCENKCIINRFPIRIIHLFCPAFVLFQPIPFQHYLNCTSMKHLFLKIIHRLKQVSILYFSSFLFLVYWKRWVQKYFYDHQKMNANRRDNITFDTLHHSNIVDSSSMSSYF